MVEVSRITVGAGDLGKYKILDTLRAVIDSDSTVNADGGVKSVDVFVIAGHTGTISSIRDSKFIDSVAGGTGGRIWTG